MGFGSITGLVSRRTAAVLLSASVALIVATRVEAASSSPATEITQAVAKTGASSVETAEPNQVLQAFAAVLVTKKPQKFAAYVTAAVQLRRDLSYKIVETALTILKLNKSKKDDVLKWANEIVVAAILADPYDADPIIRAALFVFPDAKDSIVAAAIKAAPDQEWFILRAADEVPTMAFVDSNPFGSINPVNYGGAEPVNSPEQPPTAR